MSTDRKIIHYQSPLAPMIRQLIQEKRNCGYKYNVASLILKYFDDFLCTTAIKQNELPQSIVLQWLNEKSKEHPVTYQRRASVMRQLAGLMIRLGHSAYIVPDRFGPPRPWTFKPYIFNRQQIKNIIHAADNIKPKPAAPMRQIILPEIFRLLYGCGFRVSEVLNLRVSDVDLQQGVITVREGKHGKDRLVPPSLYMVERLRIYQERIDNESLEKRTDKAFFFPSKSRQSGWSTTGIYFIFRKLLHQCGIPHAGRGKGPRVHDLRHSFAVHRLIQWYEEGADLNAKLPLLVAYLGHKDFTGTQKYLHLTAELFPNLVARMNKQFGSVIPRGIR